MLKSFLDGLLSIFIILYFAYLVTGNIVRFVFWVKCHKMHNGITHYYLDFWKNEWGTECTEEEIENLKKKIKQFEERHNETGN